MRCFRNRKKGKSRDVKEAGGELVTGETYTRDVRLKNLLSIP